MLCNVTSYDIRHPVPEGILRVRVRGVAAEPGASLGKLYAGVRVGAAKWRTATQEASSGEGVRWLEGNAQDFVIYSERQHLRLQVFTEGSLIGTDELLGCAQVPVYEAVGEGVQVPLFDREGKVTGHSAQLTTEWLAVVDEPPVFVERAAASHQPARTKSTLRTVTSTAGDAEAEMMVSVRVDEARGLPQDDRCTYCIRVSVGGVMEETPVGIAPRLPQDPLVDGSVILLARKLAPLLGVADLAEVLGISVAHAREFVQRDRLRGQAGRDEEWDREWCHRARAAAEKLAIIITCKYNYQCN